MYVAKFYGPHEVYFGMGDPEDEGNYKKVTKKDFYIFQMLMCLFYIIILIYSYVACHQWQMIASY